MINRSLRKIANQTGGKLISNGLDSDTTFINKVITDSRLKAVDEACIFAAITTSVADGHKYIQQMVEKGVKAFLVKQLPAGFELMNVAFIVVPSVKEAIDNLALQSLAEQPARRIIITGSYGKTTVKELLFTALTSLINVKRAPRSWNSAIGLPLGILDMEAEDNEIIISEVAIDGPGQAVRLKPLLKGDIGILTAIGPQHDEAFSSHKEKIIEKLNLLKGCSTIIYPSSDAEVAQLVAEQFPSRDYVLKPVKTSDPLPWHYLVKETLKDLGIKNTQFVESLPLVSSKYTITEAADGNLIMRDNFTADIRELEEVLEFASRRFTPTHTPILLVGNLLHGSLDKHSLEDLYKKAESLVSNFGIKRIIAVGDEWKQFGSHKVETFNPAHERPVNSLIIAAGNGDSEVEHVLSSIESASHDTTLEVDLEALIHNYNHYRSLIPAGTGIVAMVKASAYGLGATEIAKTLQSHGAAYLAVAVIDEGVSLREAGISMPIMVLNPVTNRYPLLFASNLEPAVFSIEELERLIDEAEKFGTRHYPIHLKLDTGMHRLGFIPSQFEKLIMLLKSTEAVKVTSIFTHLATADCLDKDQYTLSQIDSFTKWCADIEIALGYPVKQHYLNTAGMMRFANSAPYDLTRLGIGLYGISPYPDNTTNLRPVASFQTRIISLKEWEKDTFIGYGNRGKTERKSMIATIPVGYADGVDRHLGRGRASFVVKGVECPTIGNICMDLCMIDVTDVPGVKVGDEVEIFGKQMPIERIADILDTIPYEVLTSVSPRVKRRYIRK